MRKRIKTLGAVATFFSFSLLKKIIKRKSFLKEDCKEHQMGMSISRLEMP